MSNLSRAIAIAAEAHHGQMYSPTEPYVFHPLRVMMSLPSEPYELRIIGVLHDVMEDCIDWTRGRLRSEGFSDEVLCGLESVTRRDEAGIYETYRDYILRCKKHPLGRVVKIADIEDNLSRMGGMMTMERGQLERRYQLALKVLDSRHG